MSGADHRGDAEARLRELIGDWPTGSEAIREAEEHWQVATYRKLPLAVARGHGCYVHDAEGVQYLDLYGGHAVALAGHCHPRVVGAIQAQAERLLFYSNLVYSDVRARAVELLAALAPPGLRKVFLCNSGAEANETALKIARKHTGRRVVVSMTGGFHGRTLGALGATGIETYRDPAYPIPTEHRFVPYGDSAALEEAIRDDTAAVILEPIPSMGGIEVADDAYFTALRERCTATGAFLIFDEVQTGFGRTGRAFFGEHVDVVPDLITGAKGIASGFPAGVVYVREDVAANMAYGEQGTTFGGGPLACAAIAANLCVLRDEGLMGNALKREADIRRLVGNVPGVLAVVGRGLLLGLNLDRPAKPVVARLIEEARILCGTAGGNANQIRLLAPLVLEEEHVETFAKALAGLLQ